MKYKKRVNKKVNVFNKKALALSTIVGLVILILGFLILLFAYSQMSGSGPVQDSIANQEKITASVESYFDKIDTKKEFNIERYCGEMATFITEGEEIKLHYIDDELISITPKESIIVEVEETEPYIKGATVTGSFKPAFVKGGLKVMVPQYIEVGEKIIIKTETLDFVEKAK